MPDRFIARPLSPDQVDQAWPLVQAMVPGIDLQRWRSYVEAAAPIMDSAAFDDIVTVQDHPALAAEGVGQGPTLAADVPPTGMMTLQERGYIHALFRYTAADTLAHGRTLIVDDLMVLSPFHQRAADAAILMTVDGLADLLGCEAVHMFLPNGQSLTTSDPKHLRSVFRGCGYHEEGVRLCRPEPQRAVGMVV